MLGKEAGFNPTSLLSNSAVHGLTSWPAPTNAARWSAAGKLRSAAQPHSRRVLGGDIRGRPAQLDAEAALRESEARLRAMLDAMPDCVKIFDEAG